MEKISVKIGKEKYIGFIEKEWIQSQCETLEKGGDSARQVVGFFLNSDPIQKRLLPVQVRSFETSPKETFNVAKEIFAKTKQVGLNPWQALLAYNRSYLNGDTYGAFYHYGPVLPDQKTEDLVELNQFIFTRDGQGREEPDTGPVKADEVVYIYAHVLSLKPITYVNLGRDSIYSAHPAEETSSGVRQKAYLDAIVLETDIPKLVQWTGLFHAIWDRKGNLLHGEGPTEDIVTYDGAIPLSFGGVLSKQERKEELIQMIDFFEAVLGDQKLPNLVYFRVWEERFGQTDASLLEKVLAKFDKMV